MLRFGIPYGPRARPAAVIPIFVRKALDGEPLTLAGGGLQTRRFVYVEDLADGVVAGLVPQAANRTYNLVGDEEVTIREIAERVRDEIGDVELVVTEGRAGDFRGAEVSGARASRELGWEARTPFSEGLRRYVAWHREHVGAGSEAAPATVPAVAAVAGAPAADASLARVRRHVPVRRIARDVGLILLGVFAALVAALAGTIGSALLDGTTDVSHYAREHVLVAFLLILGVAGTAVTAVRWRVGARA